MVLLWLLQIAKAKRLRTHCHLTWHSIAVKLPPNTKPTTSVASRWRRRGTTKTTTTMRVPRTRTTISTPNAFATPRKVFLKKILFFEARHFYVYSSGPPLPRPPPHAAALAHTLTLVTSSRNGILYFARLLLLLFCVFLLFLPAAHWSALLFIYMKTFPGNLRVHKRNLFYAPLFCKVAT